MDGWLTPSPASGDAGQTEVTLTVGENTTGAPRNGEVKILTSLTGLETVVRVAQNAKNSLFDDDGKEVGMSITTSRSTGLRSSKVPTAWANIRRRERSISTRR